MRELTDDEIIAARKTTPSDYSRPWGDTLAFARAILAAAQAAMPSREPTRHPCGHLIVSDECVSCAQDQSAATPSTSVGDDAQHGAAQAVTDGPAADPLPPVKVGPPLLRDLMAWTDPPDPIADLCARLRDEYDGCPSPVTTARVATLREAADALERLRAERAEAERDALREYVRAADAMRAGLHQLMARYRGHSRRT